MAERSNQPVTSADVARHAGVSRATVSIVLRGLAEQRKILPETVRLVRATAERLGYVPNLMARNLRRQRSGSIGVVLGTFRGEWAESVIAGMQKVFDAAGYTPFVAVHRYDPSRAHRELTACLRRRDEGVIYQPVPGESKFYTRLRDADAPLLFLGDRPEDLPEVSFVGWDSVAAARIATKHLIQTGRQRIGFIGIDFPMQMSRGTFEAHQTAVREAGLPLRDRWVAKAPMGWPHDRIMNWALDRLFSLGCEHPDAILTPDDNLAMSLLEALDLRGIRVPDDVAVAGLGDIPMTRHSGISLTTVKEPTDQVGEQAAKVMLELVANPSKAPIHRLVAGSELKIRRTTLPAGAVQRGRRRSDWFEAQLSAG